MSSESAEPCTPETGGPAHLWFLDTGTFDEPAWAESWLSRLEPHEQERYTSFRNAAAKRDYLGTRALVRSVLAHYSGLPAESLSFTADRLGRPEWRSPTVSGLRFSLARTSSLAVGLFARDRNVGVDVERVGGGRVDAAGTFDIADRFFSAAERAELSRLEGEARLTRFYELWTLREAYLKARGVGLALPLDQLSFRPDASGGATASFGPAIRDDPAHWQFGLARVTGTHIAATCIRRPSANTPTRIVTVDAHRMVGEAARRPLER